MSTDTTIDDMAAFRTLCLSGDIATAKAILARLIELLQISSMVEVGCGRGAWLLAARELGVREREGIVDALHDRGPALISPNEVRSADLSQPIRLNRRFDLAISIDVAARLTAERAPSFVTDLTSSTDVVLFSTPFPHQCDDEYPNAQWPEFWAILFRARGFRCFDPFRASAWNAGESLPWYARNIFLYVRENSPAATRLASFESDPKSLMRVDPETLLCSVLRAPSESARLEREIQDWRALVEAYRVGDTVPPLRTARPRRASAPIAGDLRIEGRDGPQSERARLLEDLEHVLARRLREGTSTQRPDAAAQLRAAGASAGPDTTKSVWKARFSSGAPKQIAGLFRRLRIAADIRYLRDSGEFDSEFYRRMNPDIPSGYDLIEHYVEYGVREGRRPRSDFDPGSIGPLRLGEIPRNPFVIHLKRGAGRSSTRHLLSRAPRANLGQRLTRSHDPVRYGGSVLGRSSLYPGSSVIADAPETYRAQTQGIIDRFLHWESHMYRSLLAELGPSARIEARIATRAPNHATEPSTIRPTYTLITPYFHHERFFRECAQSVLALLEHDFRAVGRRRVEWIIINDDPRMSSQQLTAMLPPVLLEVTRVLSDGTNRGIASRLNEGVLGSKNDWLLFLDCDDLIVPQALDVLDHYTATFPRCRYISGSMIDIDPTGAELRRRTRSQPSTKLFEQGMVAGHLVSVRRDLFEALGAFDPRFSGCQDFEFALRVALFEPILQVPEHLYAYRWHRASQSVGQAARQHRIAEAVRTSIARRVLDEEEGGDAGLRNSSAIPSSPRGLCLVRTQGTRLELLGETIDSIGAQTVPTTPCVVVHGDADAHALVARFIGRRHSGAVILHAPGDSRRRGYPLNVALEYAEAHVGDYDFFCFLDDDDIFYPTFAERLSQALQMSGADVVFGTTNSREKSGIVAAAHAPLPTACLVVENFIPNNAYVVRMDVLARHHVRFREDIDYLEDWHFLLSLIDARCQFHAHMETLAEFRLIGDGNTTTRRDPDHFAHCSALVRARGLLLAARLGEHEFYRSLMEFDVHGRVSFTESERDILERTRRAFVSNL